MAVFTGAVCHRILGQGGLRQWDHHQILGRGRGVPVVFVHGAISDHRYWESQREAVARHYRFIAIDRRYFGTAPWTDNGANYSEATHVDDLAAFIRELKIGPAFVVGISGGANIVLLLSVQHPKLVRGLFVREPSLSSILTDPLDQKAMGEARQGRAKAEAAAKAGKMTEATKLFVDFAYGKQGSFDALPVTIKNMFVGNARTLALPVQPPITVTCAQLGQLKIPITYTTGQLSHPRNKVFAKATLRCIPGAQHMTIPNAGHGAPRQNALFYNEALLDFLARN